MLNPDHIKFFQNKENQALIEQEYFNTLYQKFSDELGYPSEKDLTVILYDSGIPVLEYINEVPDDFLYGAIAPNRYNSIIKGEDFCLREGIAKIGYQAFKQCRFIKRFYLPSTLKEILEYGLYSLEVEEIYYNGTKKDWQLKVTKHIDWTNTNKLKKIVFTDEEVVL